jgi:hypothetical protein
MFVWFNDWVSARHGAGRDDPGKALERVSEAAKQASAGLVRMSATIAGLSQTPTTKLEFTGSGFAAGVVRGARAWNINDDGMLVGITRPQVWTTGDNQAQCRKFVMPMCTTVVKPDGTVTLRFTSSTSFPDGPLDHGMEDCQHGFYAYYEGSNDYGRPARVSGVVEGFGTVVIGTRGFRCMKARIVAISFGVDVSPERRALVVSRYPDVPVFDSFEEMVAAFPPAKGETEPPIEPDEWVREA